MKTIQTKIRQVIQRLFLQNLVTRLPWFLFALLLVAVAAIAVPRLVYWDFLAQPEALRQWTLAWSWGAAGVAVLLTLCSCWWSRLSTWQAAEKLDQQFQLQQRASSALLMASKSGDPGFYEALLADAEKKVGEIVVGERFPIRSRWPMVLPVIPLLMLFGLTMVPAVAAPEQPETVNLEDDAKKKLAELIRKASNKEKKEDNLEVNEEMNATRIVEKAIEKAEKDLTKKEVSKKDAMVAINDVKKAIQDQQNKLGKADALKERLKQMKDQQGGPADEMTEALQEGKFENAAKELKKLADKLAKGEMSKEDMDKLAKQMNKIEEQLNQAKKDFENQKKDLERQIQDAAAAGDLQRAAELQKQKEDLEKQQRQMNQMQQMAQQAGKLAEALEKAKQNGGKMDQQQMQEMQDAMQQMQQQMQEMDLDAKQMEKLQEMMQQMEDMKDGLKEGKPGKFNFGGKPGNGKGDKPGKGMGDGKGEGERPTNDDGDGNFYSSKVKPDVKPGEVARIGKVGGPNRKGVTTAEIESSIKQAAENRDLTPDELQAIPFNQREHVRDYFKQLRDN